MPWKSVAEKVLGPNDLLIVEIVSFFFDVFDTGKFVGFSLMSENSKNIPHTMRKCTVLTLLQLLSSILRYRKIPEHELLQSLATARYVMSNLKVS